MNIDPKAKALLTAIAVAAEPAIDTIPLERAREQVETGYGRMKIPIKRVASMMNKFYMGLGGTEIPVRIYTPDGEGPFPVIVFFHGGGWVFFHLDAYDPICTHLCEFAACIVVSVDYRLSPEFKFPAAINDCFEAVHWVYDHCNTWNGIPDSLIVAGDSAGGNLATVVASRIRDEGALNIKGQVLIYPVTDYYRPERSSYVKFRDGYGLTGDAMQWFWDQYLEKKEDALNPWASPLLSDKLHGLPPAIVIVSGYDPLCDEGLLYAVRLKESGVQVQLLVYEDMIHGFISYLGILDQGIACIAEISSWVKQIILQNTKIQ